MSIEEIVRLIISFLGGGVVSGIINWIRTNSSEKISRRVEYLNNQIINLYGPLYFFTSQNEEMFKLSRQFNNAYTEHYVNQEWSQDETTQVPLREEATKVIDLANKYIEVVVKNNGMVMNIISNNSSYIDRDDIAIFNQFIVDYTRFITEINEDGNLITPFMIYKRLDSEISYMRPEFISRAKQKYYAKVGELKSYQA